MSIGFENIRDHLVPLEKWPMAWRFNDPKYDLLPEIHQEQIKPLSSPAAQFLWNYISETNVHKHIPFNKDLFPVVDKAKILENKRPEIKKWLYQRGLPFKKEVFLSYQPDTALIVPWKILVKYFDSFYYADDLTIIDESLSWALLFYHESEIYFGTNKKFRPSDTLNDVNFIW